MVFHVGFETNTRGNTMKKASYIFGVMKEYLHSKEFLETCKIGPKAFIRNRLLPYNIIFLFILNLLRTSIPKELNSFCKICELNPTSRPAVTKARAKLTPKAFVAMNKILIQEFYTENSIKKFHGFTPLAVDGSTLELPVNSPAIDQKYGCATNQTNQKIPMARISHLYDVINGIALDAIMAPYDVAERDLAIQHFENIKSLGVNNFQQFIAIFDRGYPSLPLMLYLLKNRIHFLMRCNSQFLKEVNDMVKANKRDTVIKIALRRATRAAKVEIKKLFPDLEMTEEITIRVVLVTLSTGEREILLTSLIDKIQYPHSIFREFYFKRWGIEENYKFHKVRLEIENFSGKSCHAIEQDFHATVLAANARALLAIEATEELNHNADRNQRKYAYEINKSVSMDGLKNEFVSVLLDPEVDIESFCTKTKNIMKRNLVPIRPGRLFKRIRKHPYRKYHMNQR